MSATSPSLLEAAALDARPGQAVHVDGRTREQGRYLRDSIGWLVRLRWLAILGIVLALWIGDAIGWERSILHPLCVAAALGVSNLAVWLLCRSRPPTLDMQTLMRQIVLQLCLDVAALTLLVYWTGGVANPFVVFFVFPVATGAVMLPTRAALLIGSTAFSMFAMLALAELSSTPPHRPYGDEGGSSAGLMDHPSYVVGLLMAAAMTLFGIVYFIRTVVTQHEHAEERRLHHELIALSRERMARVGMIAAGVAHSVRNPLHGVMNCIDLVRDSRSPAEAQETLGLMQEGLSRIEKVTSRLLALSRDAPLDPKLVDLDELVVDTVHLLQVRLQKQGITLRTELGGIRSLRCDPVRVQESLFNILDNAIAAVADVRSPAILVRTSQISEPFPGVALEVVDSGVGVAESVASRVFDPFFSTKPVGEGTGLGLAIAKEVVEAHGGVIQFLSRQNAGTNVRILLPNDPDPESGSTGGGE